MTISTSNHESSLKTAWYQFTRGSDLLNFPLYKLNCSYGQSYIGQTHRNLATRIQEHVPNGKQNQESDVAKYLVGNPNHKINFDSPEILGHRNNRRKLRIKETFNKFNRKLIWMEHRNQFICLIRNSYRKYICSALLKLALSC